MISIIDMHLRDKRLYDWIKAHSGEQVTADKLARIHQCHPNTIRRMAKRLKQSGNIRIEGDRQSIYGYRYYANEDNKCNANSD